MENIEELELSNLLNSGSTIPFDQREIEVVMRKILYENGVTDVLYEGSNISQLTSVISYVIGTLNVNTAVNLQETLLPLASKRMNVLMGARQLGYQPHNKIAYKYKLKLTPMYDETKTIQDGNNQWVTDTSDKTPRKSPLIQNTQFQSGNKTYYYKGPTIDNFFYFSNFDIQYKSNPPIGSPYKYEDFFKEIIVTEGTLTKWEDDPTLQFVVRDYTDEYGEQQPQQEFLIPHTDVEDDGLQVYVESIDYDTAPTNGVRPTVTIERTKSNHFLIDETFTYDQNKFVRMENIILQYPTIFFQYSGMGQPVATGDNIKVNVFQTLGPNGKAEESFNVSDTVASQLFLVDSFTHYSSGTDVETSENIKKNATVFNNTANRAVTKLDYIAITSRNGHVKQAEAWGGEEEVYPNIAGIPLIGACPAGAPQLGHIWISTVPNYDKGEPLYTSPAQEILDDPAAVPPIVGVDEVLEKYEYVIGDAIPGDPTLLDNWYQTDANIEGNTDSIIDYLNYYKIITMDIHHRHPLYVNFDFECDIVKYDLSRSKTEVNKEVFNGIDNYFNDQMEQFSKDYLNSNLQRNLDIILTYNSGIGYTVKTTGSLAKNMKDANAGLLTYCTLDFPFEDMYGADGYLNALKLPEIDTNEFGFTKRLLIVDYSAVDGILKSSDLGGEADINYNGVKVGRYIINNPDSKIELIFDFKGEDFGVDVEDEIFLDSTDVDPLNHFDVYAEFNINYPHTSNYNHNLPFKGNTIPRLRSVSFKDN